MVVWLLTAIIVILLFGAAAVRSALATVLAFVGLTLLFLCYGLELAFSPSAYSSKATKLGSAGFSSLRSGSGYSGLP